MDANAFRYLYDYHFAENHRLWDEYVSPLSFEKFVQPVPYSQGSVRDQVIHLISVEEVWFSELQNVIPSEPFPAPHPQERESIRKRWDTVEQNMRGYLESLRDEILFDKPIQEPEEDKNLFVWQVLLHVANHGTDHRAQLLRVLYDLGIKTTSQDFIFYVYDH